MNTKLTTTIGLLTAVAFTGSSSAALVHHWSFDSDFTDSVGANNGTLVDGDANSGIDTDAGDSVFGGGALRSQDSIDQVSVTQVTLASDADGYAVSLWVKQAAAGSSNGMTIGMDTATPVDFLWGNGSSDKLEFVTSGVVSAGFDPDPSTVTDWNHIVVVFEGTGNGTTLYLNGATATGGDASAFNFNALAQGLDPNVLSAGLAGHLDEVQIFDAAITSTEVNNLNIGNSIVPVPEPSSAALLGLGGLALILRRRK